MSFPYLVSSDHQFPLYFETKFLPLGSAVAVERVFSGGRDTISLRRASLQANTIRALMVAKHRLRLARERALES